MVRQKFTQFRGSFHFIIILCSMNPRLLIQLSLIAVFLLSCSRGERPEEKPVLPRYRLVWMYYENSLGEEGLTRYHYDLQGRNYLATWQLADSSRSSVNRHVLDSAGRMIVKSRQFSDGISSVQHFTYDSDGKLLGEDFSRSDGVTGRADYIYGPDGRLDSADCRGLNGWFYGKIAYTWEGGLKTGAVIFSDSDSSGSITYEYRDGRLIMERWDLSGGWKQTFRYEYRESLPRTFTSSNVFIREDPWFRVRSEYYTFDGGDGGPTVYAYNDSGMLVSREYIRSDGLSTLSTYDYDSTGLLLQSHRDYQDGRGTDFIYWFNVQRKLLVKTFSSTEGTSGSETYRYRDGRLVQGEYVNVDGWLNGTLVFESDKDGVLRSAEYAGTDGDRGKIEFTYDLDFNLVKIHWRFDSGHTQTCSFAYESSL